MIRSLWLLTFLLAFFAHANAETKLRGFMVARSIQPEDIAVLESWKTNVVRYPLEWLVHVDTANEEEYFAWLEQALIVFDSRLTDFKAAKIKVVLNLYSPPGGFTADKNCKSTHRLFCEAWAQAAFIKTWEKLATKYKDETGIYGFDILNEPATSAPATGLQGWNDLAKLTTKVIRDIDPTRHIIIEPNYGDLFKLNLLKAVPYKNVSYSPHFYYPLSFQHQGLYGRKLGVSYPNKNFNKKLLEEKIQRAVLFAKKNKSRIYFGEFSAVRWAPGKSSYNYLKDLISIFEKYGFDWSYHAFRESDAWSLEHDGNIKNKLPAKKTTERLKLMKSFLAKNKK
jgi:aryl-phospho-beta-D-glucosidase BglC (GH1 family)